MACTILKDVIAIRPSFCRHGSMTDVDRDNPVRFIDAFVDDLNLNEAGFARVRPKNTGRPGYDPADLLKLYIHPAFAG